MKTDLESRKKETKHFLWTFIFLPTVLTFAATFLMGAVGFIFLVFIGWGGQRAFFYTFLLASGGGLIASVITVAPFIYRFIEYQRKNSK